MTILILGALLIGLLYGFVYMIITILKCWLCSNRSTGQMIVGLVGNIIIGGFCIWIATWPYSGALFIEVWIGLFLFINPILLICTAPAQKSEETNNKSKENKSGTIEWR